MICHTGLSCANLSLIKTYPTAKNLGFSNVIVTNNTLKGASCAILIFLFQKLLEPVK
jgi:hypothetical protein